MGVVEGIGGGGIVGEVRRGGWSLMRGHIGAIGSLSMVVESTMYTYLQRIESRRFRVPNQANSKNSTVYRGEWLT